MNLKGTTYTSLFPSAKGREVMSYLKHFGYDGTKAAEALESMESVYNRMLVDGMTHTEAVKQIADIFSWNIRYTHGDMWAREVRLGIEKRMELH